MITTISTKGQIVVPAEFRQEDNIRPGEQFDIERVEAGEYILRRKMKPANEGLVDWLLSCPEKGVLTPMPFIETTDDLRGPDFG